MIEHKDDPINPEEEDKDEDQPPPPHTATATFDSSPEITTSSFSKPILSK